MSVKPVPEGYHTLTPYLAVDNAAEAIEFYKKAFGAKEIFRMEYPGGTKIGHAEISIGNSRLMLSDEHPEINVLGPKSRGGTSVSLLIYIEDVDTVFAQALEAGAKELRPLQDQFYGDRSGMVEDPFGHIWSIATHIEDIPPEDMSKLMQE